MLLYLHTQYLKFYITRKKLAKNNKAGEQAQKKIIFIHLKFKNFNTSLISTSTEEYCRIESLFTLRCKLNTDRQNSIKALI